MIPITAAVEDFRRARRRAAMRELIARFTGQPSDLLSYEDVRQKLRAHPSGRRELHDIPVDSIVGSVGRYGDFTRDFLPRKDSDAPRWVGVRRAIESGHGVPPIEVYQIGDAYFVIDGNHRVSVARETGATHIQAYVTEVRTRVPFTPGDSPDALISKAEYADFLDSTRLGELRPDADLSVTAPGQYGFLLDQIASQRDALSAAGLPADMATAASHWYDAVYMPVVQTIRDQGALHEFPGRTETDLYIWIAQHLAALQESLGWQIEPKSALSDLTSQQSQRGAVARLRDLVLPDTFEAGPAPGSWRHERGMRAYGERLVSNMLVAISGEEAGWNALGQALLVARREQASLLGLHVVPTEAARHSPAAQAVREEFERRCASAGVAGQLAIDVGTVTRQICERARLADLVVVSLSYPPGAEALARLRSGFRSLLQRCPRPILAAPVPAMPIASALLPYDGSPKAEEALFAATYLALSWKIDLTVLTVSDGQETTDTTQQRARDYLERHSVQATYMQAEGAAGAVISETARKHHCDLVVIGSYGFNPLLEIMLGSSVDQVLRESHVPVLLCR